MTPEEVARDSAGVDKETRSSLRLLLPTMVLSCMLLRIHIDSSNHLGSGVAQQSHRAITKPAGGS